MFGDMPVNLGATPSLFQQTDMPNMPTVAPHSGGMFGGGGGWQNALLAALAGFMMRRRPQIAQSILEPLQQGQILQQRLQQAQLQRKQDIQDRRDEFTFEQDYRNAHPEQGEQERMLARYLDPATSPAEKAMLGNMLQHPVAMDVTNPDGSVTRQYVYPGTIPQQQAPRVFKSLPPDAVPLNGGPMPQASGGFSRPY